MNNLPINILHGIKRIMKQLTTLKKKHSKKTRVIMIKVFFYHILFQFKDKRKILFGRRRFNFECSTNVLHDL